MSTSHWLLRFLSLEIIAVLVFISSLLHSMTLGRDIAFVSGKVVVLLSHKAMHDMISVDQFVPVVNNVDKRRVGDSRQPTPAGIAWTRIYNATTNHLLPSHGVSSSLARHSDYGTDIAIDPGGNLYLTGGWHSAQFGAVWSRQEAFNYFVAKTDPNGVGVWFNEIDSGLSVEDSGISLSLDGNGNLYVLGRSAGNTVDQRIVVNGNAFVYFLVKYDNDGKQQWIHTVSGNARTAVDLVTNLNGDSFVLGYVEAKSNREAGHIFVQKYNAAGAQRWDKKVLVSTKSQSMSSVQGNAMCADNDGALYIAGTEINANTLAKKDVTDVVVIKLSQDGRNIWQRKYGTPGRDYASAISYNAAAGQVVLAGYSPGKIVNYTGQGGTKYDFVAALSPRNGEPLWTSKLSVEDGGMHYTAIASDNTGNVHLTGRYGENGTPEFGLGNAILYAKLTSKGELVRFNVMGTKNTRDNGNGIAVDKYGDFYITGSTGGDLNGIRSDASLLASDLFITKNMPNP